MRILVYNIAYGTGHTGAPFDHIHKTHRFFRTQQRHLSWISEFISSMSPDIVGLLEVDTGSSRTGYVNQAAEIAAKLRHYHSAEIKYNKNHIARKIPIIRRQANAILAKDKFSSTNIHFFPVGMKQLIIEAEIDGMKIFLVHLSLRKKTRHRQINRLIEIGKKEEAFMIVGDFNTFSGHSELGILKSSLGLYSPNEKNLPTFPSYKPKKELDFILCSRHIKILNFFVPDVKFSDHLPLVLDFKIQ